MSERRNMDLWNDFKLLLTHALLLGTLFIFGCENTTNGNIGKTQKSYHVRLASTLQDLSAYIYIAQAKGYFTNNHIEMEIVDTVSGVQSLTLLHENRVDIAMTSDFAFVRQSLEEDSEVAILASLAETDNSELIARRTSGITDITSLKGKKIGLLKMSASEYFLENFLIARGVSPKDVILANISPNLQLEALEKGELDAIATWWPYTVHAGAWLGSEGISWNIQENQKKFWLLATQTNNLIPPEILKRVFTALLEAERFVLEHPIEAKEIVIAKTGVDKSILEYSWARTHYRIALSAEMLTNIEFEAEWVLKTIYKGEGSKPNYLNKIIFTVLDDVKPTAASIIHE